MYGSLCKISLYKIIGEMYNRQEAYKSNANIC